MNENQLENSWKCLPSVVTEKVLGRYSRMIEVEPCEWKRRPEEGAGVSRTTLGARYGDALTLGESCMVVSVCGDLTAVEGTIPNDALRGPYTWKDGRAPISETENPNQPFPIMGEKAKK